MRTRNTHKLSTSSCTNSQIPEGTIRIASSIVTWSKGHALSATCIEPNTHFASSPDEQYLLCW